MKTEYYRTQRDHKIQKILTQLEKKRKSLMKELAGKEARMKVHSQITQLLEARDLVSK